MDQSTYNRRVMGARKLQCRKYRVSLQSSLVFEGICRPAIHFHGSRNANVGTHQVPLHIRFFSHTVRCSSCNATVSVKHPNTATNVRIIVATLSRKSRKSRTSLFLWLTSVTSVDPNRPQIGAGKKARICHEIVHSESIHSVVA